MTFMPWPRVGVNWREDIELPELLRVLKDNHIMVDVRNVQNGRMSEVILHHEFEGKEDGEGDKELEMARGSTYSEIDARAVLAALCGLADDAEYKANDHEERARMWRMKQAEMETLLRTFANPATVIDSDRWEQLVAQGAHVVAHGVLEDTEGNRYTT